MSDVYGVLPTFTEGQVLSASAHLNALLRYVQALHDDLVGVSMPFCAPFWFKDLIASKDYIGIIRHRYNRFDYDFTRAMGDFSNGGEAKVTINGITVPGSTEHIADSDVDISALNLVVGEFYEVKVWAERDGWMEGKIWVNLLRETNPEVLAPLSAYPDGYTPTAAEWTLLSETAAAVGRHLAYAQPMGMRTAEMPILRHMQGTINHRCRYLAYSFRLIRSNNDEDDERWTEGQILINDVFVLRCRIGDQGSLPIEGEELQTLNTGDHTFTGLLDLDEHPGNLVRGTDYSFVFQLDAFHGGSGGLYYLYEVPESAPETDGWTPLVNWEHGQYVKGDTGSPQLQTLVDNINALMTVASYHNYPSPRDRYKGLFGIRRWRWLHYRTLPRSGTEYEARPPGDTEEIDADPTLRYTLNGKDQAVSLGDAYPQWLALDFDSVEGLYPGTPYRLENGKYALEDVES
jgi:hypothetical protein